jgi:Flp pilus assembly protein TadD
MNIQIALFALLLVASPFAATQTTATDYYNSGVHKYKAGDLDGAIQGFSRTIEIDPAHWKAYGSRGVVNRDRRDLDGAIRDYTRSIELNPKNAGAYSNRGVALRDKAISTALLPTTPAR